MLTTKKRKTPDVVYFIALIWLVHLIQWIMPGNLHQYGILPRTLTGLWHIPLAPFIHGSLFHIIANTLPLLGLGFLVHLKQGAIFWELSAITVVLGGLGTWLIGSSSYHIGASGLVLSLWSFIFADAYFRRSMRAIIIATITLALYGSLILSIFDLRPSISWAGHMSGIIAGVIVAWLNYKGEQKADNQADNI